jgi:hypothetical protein
MSEARKRPTVLQHLGHDQPDAEAGSGSMRQSPLVVKIGGHFVFGKTTFLVVAEGKAMGIEFTIQVSWEQAPDVIREAARLTGVSVSSGRSSLQMVLRHLGYTANCTMLPDDLVPERKTRVEIYDFRSSRYRVTTWDEFIETCRRLAQEETGSDSPQPETQTTTSRAEGAMEVTSIDDGAGREERLREQELASLRQQWVNEKASLLLIEERLSEFVLEIDKPLGLIKEKRQKQKVIEELERRIEELKQSTSGESRDAIDRRDEELVNRFTGKMEAVSRILDEAEKHGGGRSDLLLEAIQIATKRQDEQESWIREMLLAEEDQWGEEVARAGYEQPGMVRPTLEAEDVRVARLRAMIEVGAILRAMLGNQVDTEHQ